MTAEILATVEGGVGRLRLNRSQAIHALTLGMCDLMIDALLVWRDDPQVLAVMIDHADGRGFCAGGDIRLLAESAAGDGSAARAFYHREYRLNHLLFTYAKPIVAFMDGITMGGGVGISLPARYRVVTERTMFAMPETGIGLFPDVGGSWYLSRLPGRSGRYLAVTGARLSGADCMSLGIATHFMASEKIEACKALIGASPDQLFECLAAYCETPPSAPIHSERALIDRLFASDRLEDIILALESDPSEWANKQQAAIAGKSPTSMKVALRQLAAGQTMTDFADAMRMEYGLACHVIEHPDFVEGVRAVIVDKDNAPRWEPSTPEVVTDALIDALFAPLPPEERWTSLAADGA